MKTSPSKIGLWQRLLSRRLQHSNCRARAFPQIEALEDRCTPSLAFPAQYGAQPTTVGADMLTGDIPLYLIFAGGSGAAYGSDGTVTQAQLTDAVNNILSSSYLSGLSEYSASLLGLITITASTHVHVAATYVSSFSLPLSFNDNGNNGDINNLVSASISDGGGTLPEPDDTDPNGIYMVFTPKGYSLGSGALGHHSNGHTGSFLDPDTAYDGVVTSTIQNVPNPLPTLNEPGGMLSLTALSSLDTMTETFSHELVEMITDPDGNGSGGVDTAPGSKFSLATPPAQAENPGEIGDNEGEFYVGYENGTMVQAYWSAKGSDYIVPGGTQQKVMLNNGVLRALGDRLGSSADDSVSVDTTGTGGVQLTIDGETQQFAPGDVTQVDVGPGGGTNTVQVVSLPPGVSIQIDGSGGTTTVIAPNGPNTWQITGPGSGTLDGVVSFSSIQNLKGGTGSDMFQFHAGGSIPGTVDGGGGKDTLDYSSLAGPVTVDIGAGTAPDIGGLFSNINNFVGSGSTADTLTGPDANWTISGANAGSVNGLTFSSFENLTGAAGNDTFAFQPGGSVSGNIDGGGGTNTLDYSALTGPVSVNLQTGTASDIGGTFANISNFIGSAGSDTLTGPNVTTQWNITLPNGGTVNGSTFSSFENLIGGTGNDTFALYTGGSLSGKIDGGGGSNTLDYSNYSGNIIINLALNTAAGVAGGVFNISNIVGGSGNAMFIGNSASNLFKGGTGRSILIGGGGADMLIGGAGDSLLIGGSTVYDTNPMALNAISAEWTRTDLSFEQRVADLLSPGNNSRSLNGPYTLDKKNLVDDGAPDTLVGSPTGLTWFFLNKSEDTYSFVVPRDHVTVL
jgi:hypothetical protein